MNTEEVKNIDIITNNFEEVMQCKNCGCLNPEGSEKCLTCEESLKGESK